MTRKNKSPIQAAPPASLPHLPAAVETLRTNGFESIMEASIFCAAIGEPTTISAMVKQLGIPFSSASRVAFDLCERGWLTYTPHPTDRRKKLVRAVVERLA